MRMMRTGLISKCDFNFQNISLKSYPTVLVFKDQTVYEYERMYTFSKVFSLTFFFSV